MYASFFNKNYLGNILDVYPDGDSGGTGDIWQVVLLVVHGHADPLPTNHKKDNTLLNQSQSSAHADPLPMHQS